MHKKEKKPLLTKRMSSDIRKLAKEAAKKNQQRKREAEEERSRNAPSLQNKMKTVPVK